MKTRFQLSAAGLLKYVNFQWTPGIKGLSITMQGRHLRTYKQIKIRNN